MSGTPRVTSHRKMVVLAVGAVGLAIALTLAAFAAPDRGPRERDAYTPTDPAQVIVKVPTRDPAEIAARRQLAASPERVEVAVQLARVDLARFRALADPRYLGRAQATLARWWKTPNPPGDVRLLRGLIRAELRDLPAARADLDAVVATTPSDEAHAARAEVAVLAADYATARASCAAITEPLLAATCEAPIAGITGHADTAQAKLSELLPHTTGAPPTRTRAMLALARLAVQQGDADRAIQHVVDTIRLDDDNIAARDLWFDLLRARGHTADAIEVLEHREAVDSHLARLAIAAHELHRAERSRLVGMMRDRIENARLRGEKLGLREEIEFTLVVEDAPDRAVELARANWDLEKGLPDARLLARTAARAGDPAAARPVIEWVRTTGVKDAWLAKSLAELGAVHP